MLRVVDRERPSFFIGRRAERKDGTATAVNQRRFNVPLALQIRHHINRIPFANRTQINLGGAGLQGDGVQRFVQAPKGACQCGAALPRVLAAWASAKFYRNATSIA